MKEIYRNSCKFFCFILVVFSTNISQANSTFKITEIVDMGIRGVNVFIDDTQDSDNRDTLVLENRYLQAIKINNITGQYVTALMSSEGEEILPRREYKIRLIPKESFNKAKGCFDDVIMVQGKLFNGEVLSGEIDIKCCFSIVTGKLNDEVEEVKAEEKEIKVEEKEVKAEEKEIKAEEKEVKAEEKEVKAEEKEIKAEEKEVKAGDKESKAKEKVTANPELKANKEKTGQGFYSVSKLNLPISDVWVRSIIKSGSEEISQIKEGMPGTNGMVKYIMAELGSSCRLVTDDFARLIEKKSLHGGLSGIPISNRMVESSIKAIRQERVPGGIPVADEIVKSVVESVKSEAKNQRIDGGLPISDSVVRFVRNGEPVVSIISMVKQWYVRLVGEEENNELDLVSHKAS